MAANNLVNLIGFVGRDPEVRPVGESKKASFSLGVNGYKKDQVHWFNVEVWDRQAEFVENYIKKGTQLAVSGSLKEDRWEKDGEKRSRIIVSAEDLRFVGGGSRDRDSASVETVTEADFDDESVF